MGNKLKYNKTDKNLNETIINYNKIIMNSNNIMHIEIKLFIKANDKNQNQENKDKDIEEKQNTINILN